MVDVGGKKEIKSLNPFVETLKIEVCYKNKKTIEASPGGTIYFESRPVEVERMVCVYPQYFAEALLSVSDKGQRLLMYIFVHIRHEQDYLELKEDSVSKEIGTSRATFYRGLQELIGQNVLAKRTARANTYWINPKMFFYGIRRKKYPDSIVRINNPLSERDVMPQ